MSPITSSIGLDWAAAGPGAASMAARQPRARMARRARGLHQRQGIDNLAIEGSRDRGLDERTGEVGGDEGAGAASFVHSTAP
jgi:hypothetical protein